MKTSNGEQSDLCDLEQVTLKPQLQVHHYLTTWLQIWYHSLLWGDSIRKGTDLEKQNCLFGVHPAVMGKLTSFRKNSFSSLPSEVYQFNLRQCKTWSSQSILSSAAMRSPQLPLPGKRNRFEPLVSMEDGLPSLLRSPWNLPFLLNHRLFLHCRPLLCFWGLFRKSRGSFCHYRGSFSHGLGGRLWFELRLVWLL